MIDHSTKQFVSSAPSTDWMFVWQIGTVAYTTIFLMHFFLCMLYSRCYNKDISKEQTEGSKNNIGKKTAVKKDGNKHQGAKNNKPHQHHQQSHYLAP